jgi:hypothetical protein
MPRRWLSRQGDEGEGTQRSYERHTGLDASHGCTRCVTTHDTERRVLMFDLLQDRAHSALRLM